MIWLRLLIAVIALTISSDLSAWAQPQMQVNSPEGFYDCKGVANGANIRDGTNYSDNCCFRSQMVFCGACGDHRSFCEKQTGVCGTPTTPDRSNRCCDAHPFPCNDCNRPSMTFCESQLNQCGATPNVGCGCGQPAAGECGCNLSIVNRGCGCGNPAAGECGCNLSIVNRGCGCGNPAAGACGCNLSIVNQGCGCGVLLSSFRNCVAFNSYGGSDGGSLIKLLGSGQSGNFHSSERICVFPNGTNYTFCGKVRPTGNVCFDPDTELLLEGGRTAKARNVRVGDRLYNPVTRSSTAVTEIISGPETEAMIEVGFKGYMLKVTRQHPVLTTAGMKRAANLTTKDIVLDAFGVEQIIEYVQQAPILPNQKVINFTLDSDSTDYRHRLLVGNNVVSGDLIVQNGHLEGE